MKLKIQARSLKDLLIHLGLMVALTAAIILLFFFVYLPFVTNHGESITVPDLKGRNVADLEEILDKMDLRYEVLTDSGYDEDYGPNEVLLQDPQPHSQVKEGRKIYVTLNQENPPNVQMPNLVDRSFRNAQSVLASLGLRVGQITYKPDIAVNNILDQSYQGRTLKEGDLIPKGAEVDLVIGDGLGSNQFQLQSYLDMYYGDAKIAIMGQGLRMGTLEIVAKDETDGTPGTIIRQRPVPASGVKAGDRIDLWVVEMDAADSARIAAQDSLSQFPNP